MRLQFRHGLALTLVLQLTEWFSRPGLEPPMKLGLCPVLDAETVSGMRLGVAGLV